MKTIKIWFGTLVMVLVFGMMVIGCNNEDGCHLNGTWDCVSWGYNTFTFNNGDYEERENGTPFIRGTYTTNADRITLTPTQIVGNFTGTPLSSGWYTKAQAQTALRAAGWSETSINSVLGWFNPWTVNYSISGNTLTFTYGGYSQTFTSKVINSQ